MRAAIWAEMGWPDILIVFMCVFLGFNALFSGNWWVGIASFGMLALYMITIGQRALISIYKKVVVAQEIIIQALEKKLQEEGK